MTKKLQDDLTKLSLEPPRFVLLFFLLSFLILLQFRSECTDQCMKRKRDQENETREMRKLLNDKDERIKLLDNETKVKHFILTIALILISILDSSKIS